MGMITMDRADNNLDKMDILNIGIHIFPAGIHAFIRPLAQFKGAIEAFPHGLGHVG